MNYSLESATTNEKDFIYNLKKLCNYDYVNEIWGWNEDYQIKDFNNDFILGNFHIVKADNQNVGFLELYEIENNINITEIHLLTNYRGKGIGSDIIKSVIERAKQQGKSVTTGCFKKNTNAKDLYIRLGFKVEKETNTHFEMRL